MNIDNYIIGLTDINHFILYSKSFPYSIFFRNIWNKSNTSSFLTREIRTIKALASSRNSPMHLCTVNTQAPRHYSFPLRFSFVRLKRSYLSYIPQSKGNADRSPAFWRATLLFRLGLYCTAYLPSTVILHHSSTLDSKFFWLLRVFNGSWFHIFCTTEPLQILGSKFLKLHSTLATFSFPSTIYFLLHTHTEIHTWNQSKCIYECTLIHKYLFANVSLAYNV